MKGRCCECYENKAACDCEDQISTDLPWGWTIFFAVLGTIVLVGGIALLFQTAYRGT